jgi:hypothetical protein
MGRVSLILPAGYLEGDRGGFAALGSRNYRLYFSALAAILFGLGVARAAAAPTLAVELVVIVPLGLLAYAFVTLAMTTVQLGGDAAVRGRVMAWWALAFAGTTPIGASRHRCCRPALRSKSGALAGSGRSGGGRRGRTAVHHASASHEARQAVCHRIPGGGLRPSAGANEGSC